MGSCPQHDLEADSDSDGNIRMDVISLPGKFQKIFKSFHFIIPIKREMIGWASDSFSSGEKILDWCHSKVGVKRGKGESSGIGYRWGREKRKRKQKSTNRKSVNLQTDQMEKSFLFYLNAGKCNVDYENSNYFQGCGVTGTLIFCWWECKFSLMKIWAV